MLLQHVRCQRFLRINCRPTAAAALAPTVAAAAAVAIRYCRCGFGVGVAVVAAVAARLLAAVCQQHVAAVPSPKTKLLPHTSHGAALKSNPRVYTRRVL